MKKLLILSLFVLFVVGMSVAAFASGSNGYKTGQFEIGSNTPLSVSTSKDVNIDVQLSAESGTAPNIFVANYVIATYHKAGSRTFGTSNANQKLFFHETTGVDAPTVVDAAGTPPDWTGWAAL